MGLLSWLFGKENKVKTHTNETSSERKTPFFASPEELLKQGKAREAQAEASDIAYRKKVEAFQGTIRPMLAEFFSKMEKLEATTRLCNTEKGKIQGYAFKMETYRDEFGNTDTDEFLVTKDYLFQFTFRPYLSKERTWNLVESYYQGRNEAILTKTMTELLEEASRNKAKADK